MREIYYRCGVVTQNFLLNYSFFKIIAKLSRQVQFSSEKQKDMFDDGSWIYYCTKCEKKFEKKHYSRGTEPFFC